MVVLTVCVSQDPVRNIISVHACIITMTVD
jgi:hypothetical protein